MKFVGKFLRDLKFILFHHVICKLSIIMIIDHIVCTESLIILDIIM
ncbi:MAG: hypothetical protein K0S04_1158 [Herbinix sp.]|jgi:hypothetical protein|nr:hypothetical protein [Herbinix sp.]